MHQDEQVLVTPSPAGPSASDQPRVSEIPVARARLAEALSSLPAPNSRKTERHDDRLEGRRFSELLTGDVVVQLVTVPAWCPPWNPSHFTHATFLRTAPR